MPDDNLTPGERYQNKVDVQRGLGDNGVRLGDLRASMVAFQSRVIADARSLALARTTAPVAPPVALPSSLSSTLPARQFTPASEQSGGGGGDLVAGEIDAVIINSNGTIYVDCVLNGSLGTEAP